MGDAFSSMVLGALQGVLEWLPVSSQAYLTILASFIMDLAPGEAVDLAIALHLGTALAAIVAFRTRLVAIVHGISGWARRVRTEPFGTEEDAVISTLVGATLVTGIVGLPVYLAVKSAASILPGSTLLLLMGAALVLTGMLHEDSGKGGDRDLTTLGWGDAALLGACQGLAAVPGISRSGITVAVLLLRGLPAPVALELSFLAGIPAVLGAEVFLSAHGMAIDTVAMVTAFVTGLLSLGALMRVARKIAFARFCVIVGALTVLGAAGMFVL
ncbi:MAG: undecaprenyl-diphosphate phosphatase [Candidatus Undinarchaeales archaeon]|jgi:undecaprenyl-diphosphatase|nr:undecaprenyl-diphosphate phosphatase [Candidatus Undinarchaeales archaeon]MDP7493153.1 undecaprenyl-diphosphate phosphatase [Candidatus Undinarchaeales archaeon]